uniref:HAT C-terminal dimerisation domain-containing protein n=1 Tax=Latimeria chalumnae TaxID=7897 RepID=H3AHB1_LATCH
MLAPKSFVLACCRMRGTHSAEESGIENKVNDCVMDSAANMGKAFRVWGDVGLVSMVRSENNPEQEEDVEFTSIIDAFNEDVLNDAILMLPTHHCHEKKKNHTLNLIYAIDSCKKTRQDAGYKCLFDKSMTKVQALCNLVHHSPKASDIVEGITGITILNPNATCYMSDYRSIEHILQIGKEKINQCQETLKLEPLSDMDFNFLSEFLGVMKPLADAMILFQMNNFPIGYLTPTLKKKAKAQNGEDVRSQVIISLIDALLESTETRYRDKLTSQEYLLVAMVIPKFKLNFLDEKDRAAQKQKLIDAVKVFRVLQPMNAKVRDLAVTGNNACSVSNESSTDDDGPSASKNDDILHELHSFPHVKKYNSSLVSGAAVKRLFSVAGKILIPRQCAMSDQLFEKSVFLRTRYKGF